jgi:hypothetical protein
MATNRRQLALLAVLGLVLAFAVYRSLGTPSSPPSPASNRQAPARGARADQTPKPPEAPDVHLDALGSDRPKPDTAQRNLFRFKPKAPPPAPPVVAPPVAQQQQPQPQIPTGPPPTPPPPPIPLKFIGIMEAPTEQKKIAVLTDGRGGPIYGAEGQIVLGQYRILKIGVESVEMSYLDGRGRQTIRIGGQ